MAKEGAEAWIAWLWENSILLSTICRLETKPVDAAVWASSRDTPSVITIQDSLLLSVAWVGAGDQVLELTGIDALTLGPGYFPWSRAESLLRDGRRAHRRWVWDRFTLSLDCLMASTSRNFLLASERSLFVAMFSYLCMNSTCLNSVKTLMIGFLYLLWTWFSFDVRSCPQMPSDS